MIACRRRWWPSGAGGRGASEAAQSAAGHPTEPSARRRPSRADPDWKTNLVRNMMRIIGRKLRRLGVWVGPRFNLGLIGSGRGRGVSLTSLLPSWP